MHKILWDEGELLPAVGREDWRLVATVRDGMAAKGNTHLLVSVAPHQHALAGRPRARLLNNNIVFNNCGSCSHSDLHLAKPAGLRVESVEMASSGLESHGRPTTESARKKFKSSSKHKNSMQIVPGLGNQRLSRGVYLCMRLLMRPATVARASPARALDITPGSGTLFDFGNECLRRLYVRARPFLSWQAP